MKIFYLFLFNLFFLNFAHAAGYNSYYCEKNFRNVQIGDTTENVRAACGDPTTTTTHDVQVSTPIDAVRWTYTLGLFSVKDAVFTLPSITITLREKKVIEINRSNLPISNAACTLNGSVNIGDTAEQVLLTCGQPNYTSNIQQMVNSTKPVTEWIYNFGPYKPQIIFNFENDKLTQINSGQLGK